MKLTPTHISNIRPHDTVFHDGHARSVGNNIKHGGFMGSTLWGDSYRLGTRPVMLVDVRTIDAPSEEAKP